jgi:hypothetical protein
MRSTEIPMLESQIQERIVELLAETGSDPGEWRRVARLLNALPIYADMGGWVALRADGSMLYLDSDREEISEEIEPKFNLISLVRGSEKYPELKTLLPERALDVADCPDCRGTGRLFLDKAVYEVIICGNCSGLGWHQELK